MVSQIAFLQKDSEALAECTEAIKRQSHEWQTKVEQIGHQKLVAEHRAQDEIAAAVAPEARYLVEDIERIKDLNEKDDPDNRIDLLYPIKGDQFGDRSTWKWQHVDLLRWKTAYDRFRVYCERLNLSKGFPRLGSPVTYSRLLKILSDAESGRFPESVSSEEL